MSSQIPFSLVMTPMIETTKNIMDMIFHNIFSSYVSYCSRNGKPVPSVSDQFRLQKDRTLVEYAYANQSIDMLLLAFEQHHIAIEYNGQRIHARQIEYLPSDSTVLSVPTKPTVNITVAPTGGESSMNLEYVNDHQVTRSRRQLKVLVIHSDENEDLVDNLTEKLESDYEFTYLDHVNGKDPNAFLRFLDGVDVTILMASSSLTDELLLKFGICTGRFGSSNVAVLCPMNSKLGQLGAIKQLTFAPGLLDTAINAVKGFLQACSPSPTGSSNDSPFEEFASLLVCNPPTLNGESLFNAFKKATKRNFGSKVWLPGLGFDTPATYLENLCSELRQSQAAVVFGGKSSGWLDNTGFQLGMAIGVLGDYGKVALMVKTGTKGSSRLREVCHIEYNPTDLKDSTSVGKLKKLVDGEYAKQLKNKHRYVSETNKRSRRKKDEKKWLTDDGKEMDLEKKETAKQQERRKKEKKRRMQAQIRLLQSQLAESESDESDEGLDMDGYGGGHADDSSDDET